VFKATKIKRTEHFDFQFSLSRLLCLRL